MIKPSDLLGRNIPGMGTEEARSPRQGTWLPWHQGQGGPASAFLEMQAMTSSLGWLACYSLEGRGKKREVTSLYRSCLSFSELFYEICFGSTVQELGFLAQYGTLNILK